MLKNDLDSIEFENNVNIKTSAKMIDNTISIKLNLVCKPIDIENLDIIKKLLNNYRNNRYLMIFKVFYRCSS